MGKKKCGTCQVPVLVCSACLSNKCGSGDDKGRAKGSGAKGGGGDAVALALRMRCPLCVREGVSVPASALGLTNNGKQAYVADDGFGGGGGSGGSRGSGGGKGGGGKGVAPKAAPTVCVWGGGQQYSQGKKRAGRAGDGGSGGDGGESARNWSSGGGAGSAAKKPRTEALCRFGAACKRSDCWFKHLD